jgi:hypothetical protein
MKPNRINIFFFILISSLIVFPQTLLADFPNLVPNSGFEKDNDKNGFPDVWQLKGNKNDFSIHGKGYKSKRALTIHGKGRANIKVKNIQQNKFHLLSMMIGRSGWRDGEYPTIKIFDKEFYLNELSTWGKWQRYSWVVHSKDFQETEVVLSNPGITHKLWFDDIYLTEFNVKTRHPENGAMFKDKFPTLEWTMPDNERVFDIKIELSQKKDFQEKKIVRTYSPLGNKHLLEENLKTGFWYWRLKVYKNRVQIAESNTGYFQIANNLKARSIYQPIQPRRNYSYNDFFPIGIYSATIESFSELKGVGFNSVQTYNRDQKYLEKFITEAEKHGLKTMAYIPSGGDLDSFFKKIDKDSPILAWYLADEPELRATSPKSLWKLKQSIKEKDPLHPTSLVILRSKRVADYAPATDIVMVDPYPIPRLPLTWLSDSIDEARKEAFNEKPVWAVVQAFNWKVFPSGGEKFEWGREPTYDEMKCLTYLSVVHGARGVFYFCFQGGEYHIKNHPELWANIKNIVNELNQIYPLLLAPDTKNIPISIDSPDIHYSLKKVDKNLQTKTNGIIKKGYYLIAVNGTNKPVKAIIKNLVFQNDQINVLFENRILKKKNQELADTFKPYEVHIYNL